MPYIFLIIPAACCGEPFSRHSARSRIYKFIDPATSRRVTTDTMPVRMFIFDAPIAQLDRASASGAECSSSNLDRRDS